MTIPNQVLGCVLAVLAASAPLVADVPVPWQMGFQEAASPQMAGIQKMHTLLLWIIGSIALLVTSLLVYVIVRFRASKNPVPSTRSHHVTLEIIWTMIPVLILLVIGIPSLKLLYQMDSLEGKNPEMTVKVVGHQWYWTYEYPGETPDLTFEFDSRMIPEDELQPGDLRMLSVDNPLIIPAGTLVKFMVTSEDVLHSFAVPSFGFKKDAVPGRINETWAQVQRTGTYRGQCSELCGINHGMMPIAVKVVPKAEYQAWEKKMRPRPQPKPEATAVPKVGTVVAPETPAGSGGVDKVNELPENADTVLTETVSKKAGESVGTASTKTSTKEPKLSALVEEKKKEI